MNGLVLILIILGFAAVPLVCFTLYAYLEYQLNRNPYDSPLSEKDQEYYDSLPLK
jgi:hypothetical protein